MIANQLRLLVLAIRRYTRFPVPPSLVDWAHAPGLDTRRALRFMPLTGLLIGLYNALTYLLFAQILPHSTATLLAVIAGVLISGGRHELALTRFVDGVPRSGPRLNFPSRWIAPRGRRGLPRFAGHRMTPIGAAGALVLVLITALRIETLASLDPTWISIAMMTAQPFSSGVAAVTLLALATRGRGGSGWSGFGDRLLAFALAVTPALLALIWTGQTLPFLLAAIPSVCFGLLVRRWVRLRVRTLPGGPLQARASGATIDNGTGASQQFAEVAYYLGLLVWWSVTGNDTATSDSGDADTPDDDQGPE